MLTAPFDARLKRRVQTARIAVRQALQIGFVESRVTSDVGYGRGKRRFRHKREI
jgi:SRSO17 transposase